MLVAVRSGLYSRMREAGFAVEVGELHADGKASDAELLTPWRDASTFFGSNCCYGTSTGDQAARGACAPAAPKALLLHEHKISYQRMPDGFRGQADVLRDAFGNPFRPVGVDVVATSLAVYNKP